MHCSLCRPRLSCGLALMLLSGCQWYSPYGYGYPGTYAPPGGMMPQQTFPAPPGALRSGPPAMAPGGNPGSPTFVPPVNSGANSAPPWRGNSTGGAATNETPIPKYGEPDGLGGSGASRSDDGENKTPFTQMGSRQRDAAYAGGVKQADAASDGSEPFQKPVQLDAESMRVASNGAPIPYDYDRHGYKWLTGKVDYDAGDKSWNIIYNLRPGGDDKLGGSIHLLDDGRLSELHDQEKLHDQDIVQVKGEVDSEHRDANGKPQYRIAELHHVVPRSLAN